MTGAWISRKGPSSALFLITDTRPLILRAVRFLSIIAWDVADYRPKVPYILSFSLFMILAGLTLPRTSGMSGADVPRSAH
jgi:phosphatidylinositol 4-phosphatase